VGKNVPTALNERINVRFREEDGTDEVTLEKEATP
jgi:pyrimidine operon attenuation protein/uracil phosphoribosyltransferase